MSEGVIATLKPDISAQLVLIEEVSVFTVLTTCKIFPPPPAAVSKPCDKPAPVLVKTCPSVPNFATSPEPLVLK